MGLLPDATLKAMKRSLPGKRVRFVGFIEPESEPSDLQPGTEGVVQYVDDGGTMHVKWDDDRRLGLVPGDRYELC